MKETKKKSLLKALADLEKVLSHKKQEILDLIQELERIEVEATPKKNEPLPPPAELIGKMFGHAIYSDGGCRGNPGPGAWACFIQNIQGDIVFEMSGGDELTTNNKMELTGAIKGLEAAKDLGLAQEDLVLVTDSQYVVKGIKEWIKSWKARGWKKADKKPPENLEHWQELDLLVQQSPLLDVQWVKGHSGHPQNEYCDELLNQFMDSMS